MMQLGDVPLQHKDAAKMRLQESEVLEERRLHLEEKQRLDEQAASMTRQFHMEQHKADKRLRALEFNIQLKQDLIRNLVKTEQTLQGRNEAAEAKIADLEAEIMQMKTAEATKSHAPPRGGGGGVVRAEDMTPESRRIRDQFTAKLRAREVELEGLRKAQDEGRKILRDYEMGEKKIRSLEGEISKMNQQCDQLKRKVRPALNTNTA